jgi:heme-degrading monooxygenase HmoA
MYMQHERYRANAGFRRELEARLPKLHELEAKQPGFVAADFLRYMGNLNTYLAVRVWESRDTAQAFSRTPDFQAYLESRPADAYASPPEIEHYEQVCEEHGSGAAKFAYHFEFDVAGGQARVWQERELELYALLKNAPGFHSARGFRFLGNNNRHMRIALWESREALVSFTESPEFRARGGGGRTSIARSPTQTEFYEVLHKVAAL